LKKATSFFQSVEIHPLESSQVIGIGGAILGLVSIRLARRFQPILADEDAFDVPDLREAVQAVVPSG